MAKRAPLRACQFCGALFPPRKREQRHCSRTCAQRHAAPDRIEKTCEQCGGQFDVPPSGGDRRFCSRKCKGLSARVERRCEVCGAQAGPRSSTCSMACAAQLAVRKRARPWHVGPRTLLARTCEQCGVLLSGDQFPTGTTDKIPGRSCKECAPKGHSPEAVERARQNAKDLNVESRAEAGRHGYQWTGPELEIAARPDLTAREVAAMLGRTIAAVKAARQKSQHDPKWQRVAGL